MILITHPLFFLTGRNVHLFSLLFSWEIYLHMIYIYIHIYCWKPFLRHTIIFICEKNMYMNCNLVLKKIFCDYRDSDFLKNSQFNWTTIINSKQLIKNFISNFENNLNKRTKFHWNTISWFTFPWKTHINYQSKKGLKINYIPPLHSYGYKCWKFCSHK